jgi:PLP dependent protein
LAQAQDLITRYRGVVASMHDAQLASDWHQKVSLMAVSKGHDAADVRVLSGLGQRDFGESRWQEARGKLALLDDLPLVWHFIGRIQKNKASAIAKHFAWVHGVDCLEVAQLLSRGREGMDEPLNVCIQVRDNIDLTRAGVSLDQVAVLVEKIKSLPGLCVRGLMAIPRIEMGRDERARFFARIHVLWLKMRDAEASIDTLSLGMSGDFEEAIMAGSNLIRIGSSIFGDR